MVSSRMFKYVFVLLAVLMIIFFVVTWMGPLMGKPKQRPKELLKVNMENSFKETMIDKDSDYEEFVVPKKVKKVCFLDTSYSQKGGRGYYKNTSLCNTKDKNYNRIVCEAWGAKDQKVVFVPKDAIKISIDVPDLKVRGGHLCVNNTNGKVMVKLNGQEEGVKVSKPS